MASHSKLTAFDVMHLLGHNSLDIVVNYFHPNDQHIRSAMAEVAFDQLVAMPPADPNATTSSNKPTNSGDIGAV